MKWIDFGKLISYTIAIGICCQAAHGQRIWDKKPYQQWSELEALQIGFDSPWAKDVRNADKSYGVLIRLHSALTLRQALLRLKQLLPHTNYDKLAAAEQARFDAQIRAAFECADCSRYYIITLTIVPTDQNVVRWLRNLTLDELTPYVFLANDEGERRNLVAFTLALPGSNTTLFAQNVVFFFERFDQGKPLISTNNKKLYFSIDEKRFKGKPVSFGTITFDVSKLIRNGKIDF